LPTLEKINNPDAKKLKVLIAPLDWGLGHVTRCIPVIKELLNQQCIVVAAVSGVQKTVLHSEFPDLSFVELPGYGIKFGKNRALTIFQLISSIPKILIRVNREKAWLSRWILAERPDLIISDNRYGLYARDVLSIFITHQLLIRTPFGPVADRLLQRVNYRFIRRFRMCWVPDVPGPDGLAGELSHPDRMLPVPTRYIGWLSRFGPVGPAAAGARLPGAGDVSRDSSFELLVLLSGPEPQRTLLEERILEQAADYTGRIVLVRGLPDGGKPLSVPARIHVYNHVPAAELEVLIRGAGQIICRSGYSTVMDLVRLGKKAILIPTPGQTEQEYLGDYLAAKGWAICIDQKGFSLGEAMSLVTRGRGGSGLPDPAAGDELLQKEIRDVLKRLYSCSPDLG
jgi:UDP:flavonoid glycosyltransferase YjiC (YdhE family)